MIPLVVYPNRLDLSRRWFSQIHPGLTINQFLSANVKSYFVTETPPFSVRVNGKPITTLEWDTRILVEGDTVEMFSEAKDPVTAILAVVAVVSAVVAYQAMSNVPDTYQKTTPEGSSIYSVNSQGNQAKLMGAIPELFGYHKTFPDLISEAHWYFEDDEEYLLLALAISVGEVELDGENIVIADTKVSRYGSDIYYKIFGPGEDVSSHPAHENMYTSREVGSTSGTSGIELESGEQSMVPDSSGFIDQQVSLNEVVDGLTSTLWPQEWAVGKRFTIINNNDSITVSEFDEDGGWIEHNGYLAFATTIDYADGRYSAGDYIQYPTGWDAELGQISAWATGTILQSGSLVTLNEKEFYLVTVTDANGSRPLLSAVPDDARDKIIFNGHYDATYRINSITDSYAVVSRYFPNASTLNTSWVGFFENSSVTGLEFTVLDDVVGVPAGPYFACPESETTDRIIIDIKFTDGIGYVNDDASVSSRTLSYRVQWRAEGETEWSSRDFSRTGATRDQLGKTHTIALGRNIRPEVQVFRLQNENNNSRYLEAIEWVRLKCKLETVTKYDDFTTLMIQIKGTNSLSQAAQNKLGVIPMRKLPIPDGNGGWTEDNHATRDLAPVIRYIIRDAGLSSLAVNDDELIRLHNIWKPRKDYFDGIFSDVTTLFEALKKVMAVGYAEPTLEYGQIVPVRDEPRTSWDHMYMPDNMTGKGLEVDAKLIDEDEPDGIEVEFTSPENWKSDTVLCLLDDDIGADPEKVRAFGIIDKNKAYQFGMRQRLIKRHRRYSYSFGTEMDAFNSRYLDYVALGDNVPGYSQNGRVDGYSYGNGVTKLILDTPLSWGAGTHHIALRKPNGRTSGPYVAIIGNTPFEVYIDGRLDFAPIMDGTIEPPFFMFGEGTDWCYPALISDVTPQGTEKCSVKAWNYAEEVYSEYDSFPFEVINLTPQWE